MSRVGKYPIKLPQGVTVTIDVGKATVKGKLGELSCGLSDFVKVTVQDGEVVVEPVSKTKECRMIWGTTRANLNNMVKGVTEGFIRKLELVGVGYKAQASSNGVKLSLGYSHDIDYVTPKGVKITCPSQTEIQISGIDKREVGAVASEIRAFRSPEPYKGKGVKYVEETIVRKEGKKK